MNKSKEYQRIKRYIRSKPAETAILPALERLVPKSGSRRVQLQYHNGMKLHKDVKNREGYLADATLYPDADIPEVWRYLQDLLIEDAALDLGLQSEMEI